MLVAGCVFVLMSRNDVGGRLCVCADELGCWWQAGCVFVLMSRDVGGRLYVCADEEGGWWQVVCLC